jgi:hypothetical protein
MTRRLCLLPLAAAAAASEKGLDLPQIRRIHVERLAGGEVAGHFRNMLISAIQRSRLFEITENPDRADAILVGSAEDLVFTDRFSSTDSIQGRVSVSTRPATNSNRTGGFGTAGVGQTEAVRIEERKHEATASVRLVNRADDVVWSTTQESLGAKFRGASADVAEKIVKQLRLDLEAARKSSAARSAR